jgi:hypothetical protein
MIGGSVQKFSFALASFLFCSACAYASVTADLKGAAPATVSPGTYRYTYTMTLQSDVLAAGDFFVLYDFYGYKPGSMTGPAGWTTNDSAASAPIPSSTRPENGAVANLQWIYAGSAISANASPVILGRFAADSSVQYTGRLMFGGMTSAYDYYSDGVSNPEPSSALLLLGGVGGLAYLHKRRTRRNP